jgi:hypothetical protein
MFGDWQLSDVARVVWQELVVARREKAPPLPEPERARPVAFDLLSAATRLRAAAVGSALGLAIAPPPTPLSSDPTATVGRRRVVAPEGRQAPPRPPERVWRERWGVKLRLPQRVFSLAGSANSLLPGRTRIGVLR